MRRAFVGASTPVGYCYGYTAKRTKNDTTSSPNPLIFGSTALLILYDEIWFICESFCPEDMRGLPYVKFLDRDAKKFIFTQKELLSDHEELLSLVDNKISAFDIGWQSVLNENFGEEFLRNGKTDNHTHGINALGLGIGGNCDLRSLILDTWIIAKYHYLNLEIALNPFSAVFGTQVYGEDGTPVIKHRKALLTQKLLRIDTTIDLKHPKGPYHPCLDELREDKLIREFRKWIDSKTSSLHNQEVVEIENDVNNRVKELNKKALRKYVSYDSSYNVLIDLAKSSVLDFVYPASIIARIIEKRKKNAALHDLRWQAFIATSRSTAAEYGKGG